MSKEIKCLNCESIIIVPKRSSRQFCTKTCATEYRKKQQQESSALKEEPTYDQDLKDLPPKEITIRVNDNSRPCLFTCTTCLHTEFGLRPGEVIIPAHRRVGTFYGTCPRCKNSRDYNPEMPPNMAMYIRLPAKDEPQLSDADMEAAKGLWSIYARKAIEP